jgi:hypothetical protein
VKIFKKKKPREEDLIEIVKIVVTAEIAEIAVTAETVEIAVTVATDAAAKNL